MKFRLVLSVVSLCFAIAPVLAGGDKATNEQLDKLRQQYSEAIANGDTEKLVGFYTEDAVLMIPNAPSVVGRNMIRQQFSEALGKYNEKMEIRSEETQLAGDWAYDRGTLLTTVTPKSGGEPMKMEGKYVVILKKDTDGSWKLSRVIFNENAPPQQPMTTKTE